MFRGRALTRGFLPRPGDRVEVRARVTLYRRGGIPASGRTDATFLGWDHCTRRCGARKSRLAAEGLFDSATKREIARLPRAVGVIIAFRSGFARRADGNGTARSAYSDHHYPPGQGTQAPLQLRRALALANERREVDTLLLVRGGGSIEDLWAFNDESLARDVAASLIPVVCSWPRNGFHDRRFRRERSCTDADRGGRTGVQPVPSFSSGLAGRRGRFQLAAAPP